MVRCSAQRASWNGRCDSRPWRLTAIAEEKKAYREYIKARSVLARELSAGCGETKVIIAIM